MQPSNLGACMQCSGTWWTATAAASATTATRMSMMSSMTTGMSSPYAVPDSFVPSGWAVQQHMVGQHGEPSSSVESFCSIQDLCVCGLAAYYCVLWHRVDSSHHVCSSSFWQNEDEHGDADQFCHDDPLTTPGPP
jgi:hypothetical protein